MTRRRIAIALAILVALCGALPVSLLGAAGLRIIQQRGERASQDALQAIAAQAAARIEAYVAQQREMLRTLAMAVGSEPDATRRLADASLDAPSLGKMRLISPASPEAELPRSLSPEQMARARAGVEVASPPYLVDLSPAMDVCVPSGAPGRTVCATLDLMELQRQVQRIRVGESGYALAFDRSGRLLATGSGSLRAAVLSGEPVGESPIAAALSAGAPAPQRLRLSGRRDMFAGWAVLHDLGWSIAVEQPADEALQGARTALTLLGLGAVATLLLSIGVGYWLARRMLASLELEERFRMAGQIAGGISHDLGHRLVILQQIEQLAAMNDADYLPRIRDSLAAEVGTLRRFVRDFADLTREARPADFTPVEINALAESARAGASSYAEEAQVRLHVSRAPSELWIWGDRYLLERATLNLIRNAIEASQPGGAVRLRIEKRGSAAILVVEDEGGGIPDERIPGLFEAFASTKRTGAHVGMGLPNVKRIVTAHRGHVSVISRAGRGSAFTIWLPAADQSSSPSPPTPMP
ncbi:MAG TPA: sensor histidine kinase [Myxococcales bacterium]|nr:sensor histidine kinase [Myxococcales bacterium]